MILWSVEQLDFRTRGSHIEEYAGLSLVRKSKSLKCFAHYHARDLTIYIRFSMVNSFQVFFSFFKNQKQF